MGKFAISAMTVIGILGAFNLLFGYLGGLYAPAFSGVTIYLFFVGGLLGLTIGGSMIAVRLVKAAAKSEERAIVALVGQLLLIPIGWFVGLSFILVAHSFVVWGWGSGVEYSRGYSYATGFDSYEGQEISCPTVLTVLPGGYDVVCDWAHLG